MTTRSGRPSVAARSFARFQSARGSHIEIFTSPCFAARSMTAVSDTRGALLSTYFPQAACGEALQGAGRVADLPGRHGDGEIEFPAVPLQPILGGTEPVGGLLHREQMVRV